MYPAPIPAKTRDVSVVITSYLAHRLQWVKHSLNFLYRHGYEGETLVGVWGGHDKIDDLISFCMSLSLRIRVIHQDGAQRFTQRVLALAERTTGQYIAQTGDDDFLLPEALGSLVKLLAQDPSVFCAQGRTISIGRDFTDTAFRVFMFPVWPAPEADLLTRYARYCAHTGQMFHAMFRRADYIERYRWMEEAMAETKNHIWFEFIGEFFPVIKGRFVIIEEIFILRGKHANNTSRLLNKDSNEERFPFFLLSANFSPTYKFVEGQVLRLFAGQGADVANPATREVILTGIVNCLGSALFNLRGPPPQEEVDLKAIFTQSPPHPLFVRIVQMVMETRV